MICYIVDLRSFLSSYCFKGEMYDIYTRFTLTDLVESLLLPTPQYMENIWHGLDRRFTSDRLDELDLEALEMFFELMAEDLDKFIVENCIPDFQFEHFRFKKWLSHHVVLLEEINEHGNHR